MGSSPIGFSISSLLRVENGLWDAWTLRWHTMKHPFNANVLIDIRPVNSLTVANQSPPCALSGSRL